MIFSTFSRKSGNYLKSISVKLVFSQNVNSGFEKLIVVPEVPPIRLANTRRRADD